MPWRLIGFIICIVLVTVFAGFNLDNRCNISFGFYQLENVPIFFSLMAAFVFGVLVVLPFTFGKRRKKNTTVSQSTARSPEAEVRGNVKKTKPTKKNSKAVTVPQNVASPVPESAVKSSSGNVAAESGAKK